MAEGDTGPGAGLMRLHYGRTGGLRYTSVVSIMAMLTLLVACSGGEPEAATVAEDGDVAEAGPPPEPMPDLEVLPVSELAGTEVEPGDAELHFGFGPAAKGVPYLPCIDPAAEADSLIYGDIGVSEETGDASGLEILVEARGDSLRGFYAEPRVGCPILCHWKICGYTRRRILSPSGT